MTRKEFDLNITYLEDNGVSLCSTKIWPDKPFSVELEYHTDAGGDMIIHLDEPSKECLEGYIDGFDIDDEILLWWGNGKEAAKKKGVPFDNIREHINDLEKWLADLREIVNTWPS